MEASKRVNEALITLAWSLWTELGVAGVGRHHRPCAVDPEALLLFTASLCERDPRLRDESLDCALALAPYLSMGRLKSMLTSSTDALRKDFAPYAATFNMLSKTYVKFPVEKAATSWKVTPSGKSRIETFDLPSQVILRSRAIFGVSVRADILVAMQGSPQSRPGWIASDLAEYIGLPKRGIASTLQDLERGGILRATPLGNRLRYDFIERKRIEGLLNPVPRRIPYWRSILPFFGAISKLVDSAPGRNETALLVDAQKLVELFLAAQARLGRFTPPLSYSSWPEVVAWLVGQIETVAGGRTSWLDEPESRSA